MSTILESYFLQTNPKSRLFQNVKEVPTNGIPKIGRIARFLEFQKYGLFLHRCRFMEFHLYSILLQFSNFVNSQNRHYFQNIRFVYFQEYILFLKWTDFWNSNSRDYLVSIPISKIPEIWKFHIPIFQSIIQKWPYPRCIEQSIILPILQVIGRVPFSLLSPYFRRNFGGPRSTNLLNYLVFSREFGIHLKTEIKQSIPFTRISLNFSLN